MNKLTPCYIKVYIFRRDNNIIIILILHLSVRESGRSREAIRPELKKKKHFFLFIAGLGRYMRQCTDTAGNGTSRD